MFKKLAIALGMMLIVLAIACGGSDKESTSDKADNDTTPAATKAAKTKVAPTEAATEEADDADATEEADDGEDSDGAMESLSFLTGGMLGGESENSVIGAADPELANLLIASTDLPTTFASVGGDMGFSMDLPQGAAKMAMRTFSQGDPNMSEMTPTIVSAAVAMPAAALEEFDSQLAQLDDMTTEDIQEAMGGSSMMGIEFKELDVGTIDLGEGGMSMHMVMDMSGLTEMMGDLAEEMEGFPTALSFDMYVFKVGDTVLMAMTMLPADQESPVDVESLAKIMESRAQ